MVRRIANGWRLCALFIAIFSFPMLAANAAPPTTWPQTGADLPADPAITFGVLDNGVRYAIRHNASPPGQVSMRLVIQAGSAQEAHDQEGLAHMLEHMAFHGSTHIANADVFPMLERLGMRVGADINAGTTRDMTLYKFDLSRNDETSVDTGLLMLREIGGELLLDPALVDAERKVVMAEAYTHSAPLVALGEVQSKALFGNHPYGRDPIGRPDVIEHAPVQRLRDFYNAYYRPERAVLIVVGDIDPAALEAKIKARFSDWHGKGVPGSDPAPLKVTAQPPRVQLATIKGLDIQAQGIRLFYLHPYRPYHDSKAETVKRIVYGVGLLAAQLRLAQLDEQAGKPFASGGTLSPMPISPDIADIDYGGATGISDWRNALDLLLKVQRQVTQYGLTQLEVDKAISLLRGQLEGEVVAEASAQTRGRADSLVAAVEVQAIPRSRQQTLALFNEVANGLKADQVTANLVSRYTDSPVVLYATSQAPEGGEAALKAEFAKANAAPVQPFAAVADKMWSYTDFGKPGTVAERHAIPEAGVTMVRFANNVRLTVKQTDFNAGEIFYEVRFGHGQLDLPKDKLAASDLAMSVLNMGGYRDMTSEEASRALMGKGVMAVAKMDEDAFVFAGPPISTGYFDLELQALAAKVSAPGWRTDNWQSVIGTLAQSDDSDASSPADVYEHDSPSLLHPGDQRWVMDTQEMRKGWKAEDAVAFIKPILENAPLEIVVVGDITPDRAIAAVAKTFGALPSRADMPEAPGIRSVTFPVPTAQPVELHHTGPAFQALAIIDWPATDVFADTRQSQAAGLLAAIMQERAFVQLRNKEGKTYSPSVVAALSEALPGYGMISARALVEPADLRTTFTDFDSIAADLAANEVSSDELNRVLGARIEEAQRLQHNNAFWLHYLAGAQADPRRLQLAIDEVSQIKSLTASDVKAAAQKWLVKGKSWRMMITPMPQPAKPHKVKPARARSSARAH